MMAHYGWLRTQRFLNRAKNMMAHCGWLRTQRFLFRAKIYDGALWIVKDPTFLISDENL